MSHSNGKTYEASHGEQLSHPRIHLINLRVEAYVPKRRQTRLTTPHDPPQWKPTTAPTARPRHRGSPAEWAMRGPQRLGWAQVLCNLNDSRKLAVLPLMKVLEALVHPSASFLGDRGGSVCL